MFELINITPNPFLSVDQSVANNIIFAEKKKFGTLWRGGRLIYDYSAYFKLYQDMCLYYLHNHNHFLNRAPEMQGMSIGRGVIYLLKTGKF